MAKVHLRRINGINLKFLNNNLYTFVSGRLGNGI